MTVDLIQQVVVMLVEVHYTCSLGVIIVIGMTIRRDSTLCNCCMVVMQGRLCRYVC